MALLKRMRFRSDWIIHRNEWTETAPGKPTDVMIKILQPRGTRVASKLIDQYCRTTAEGLIMRFVCADSRSYRKRDKFPDK